jgi:hypothetical protein
VEETQTSAVSKMHGSTSSEAKVRGMEERRGVACSSQAPSAMRGLLAE